MCGCDTAMLERILSHAARSIQRKYDEPYKWLQASWGWRTSLMWKLGFNEHETLWHADHILAVHKGGGECGLEGYQTLCVPCHKIKTRAERKARAILRPLLQMLEARTTESTIV